MRLKAGIIHVLLTVVLMTGLFLPLSACAGESFTVRRIGNIHPYADNAFRISTSESGFLEIRIHDSICTYRTLSQEIPEGETVIHWDGCGYNREKL